MTDPDSVLSEWANHFSRLERSQCPSMYCLNDIEITTYQESDHILDLHFAVEEVEVAIRHLKKDSSGGRNQLFPRHLLTI